MPIQTADSIGRNAGFSLIELVIVLLVVGIMTAFAVPSIGRYRMGEQTRENAQQIASVLRSARSASIKEGVSHFVLFNPASPPAAEGTIARVVRDVDGDWQVTGVDLAMDYKFLPATHADVVPYGTAGHGTPHSAANAVPGDATGGQLSGVVDGANFPADPVTGRPAVGFTAQGVAVDLNNPTAWGTGAGAFYVTDSSNTVYAAVVGPLGEVRVRVLSPGTGEWK
jgi:prepilin-type N-terminal cleavage/methylation domain-containing protein